jgi:hypothetical protein
VITSLQQAWAVAPEHLFRPPSIYIIADMVVTLVAIFYFSRALLRISVSLAAITTPLIDEDTGEAPKPQQYRRLIQRMDQFEVDQKARERQITGRLDAFEYAQEERERQIAERIDSLSNSLSTFQLHVDQREIEDRDFRNQALECNNSILSSNRRLVMLVEKSIAKSDYVQSVLERRPCIVSDSECSEETCPDGNDISPKK